MSERQEKIKSQINKTLDKITVNLTNLLGISFAIFSK
jgi:hypothetical protein